MKLFARYLFVVVFLAMPVMAVEPDEILADTELETRARIISAGIRCVQCQNESIDDSAASIARDMRLLVRERLVAGDSDEQVIAFIVDRYGEFVLLRPRSNGVNFVLWLSGPVMLIMALIIGGYYVFGSREKNTKEDVSVAKLSAEEKRQLDEIMKR